MNSRIFILLLIVFTLSNFSVLKAQEVEDSLNLQSSEPIKLPDLNHSPKKAAIYSASLPGLGQAYNKKYWKIPIIYVGFGTLTYFIVENQKNYTIYRDAYGQRIDDDPNNDTDFPQYTTENLRLIKDMYWKNRDLCVILISALYTINILDAVVDAHFFTYDISDNLSLNFKPEMRLYSPQLNSASAGITLTLNFK